MTEKGLARLSKNGLMPIEGTIEYISFCDVVRILRTKNPICQMSGNGNCFWNGKFCPYLLDLLEKLKKGVDQVESYSDFVVRGNNIYVVIMAKDVPTFKIERQGAKTYIDTEFYKYLQNYQRDGLDTRFIKTASLPRPRRLLD